MSSPLKICPYWSDELSTWVFDDPAVDLNKEPFVCGAPATLDILVQDIPNAHDGVCLLFSASPYAGFQRSLSLKREGEGGNWYGLDGSSMEGWLCPALFKYFSTAPAKLYVRVEPKN